MQEFLEDNYLSKVTELTLQNNAVALTKETSNILVK